MPSEHTCNGRPVVFVDIDGTLSHANHAAPRRRMPSNPLAGILMERGLAFDEAQERVCAAEAEAGVRPGSVWPFGADRLLGVPDGMLAAYTVNCFRRRYAMHPDAKRFMLGLRAFPGIRVYPATTNPRLFILGKLASGGLADERGTAVFDDCFGGEEVSPGGKCGPGFYHALCVRTGAEPSNCFMVGDEPLPDLDYARGAGIERVFIVNRDQAEPRRDGANGGVFVSTLDEALSSIEAECGM
jgi:FMN phosphatase YigB (HAD superfamily)